MSLLVQSKEWVKVVEMVEVRIVENAMVMLLSKLLGMGVLLRDPFF